MRCLLVTVPVQDVDVDAVGGGGPGDLRAAGVPGVVHLDVPPGERTHEDILLGGAPLDVLDRPGGGLRGGGASGLDPASLAYGPHHELPVAVPGGEGVGHHRRPVQPEPFCRVPVTPRRGTEEERGRGPRLPRRNILTDPLAGVVELLEVVCEVVARHVPVLSPRSHHRRPLRHAPDTVHSTPVVRLLRFEHRVRILPLVVVVVVVLVIVFGLAIVVLRAVHVGGLHQPDVVLLRLRSLTPTGPVACERELHPRRPPPVLHDVEGQARPVDSQLVEHVVGGRVVHQLRPLGHLVNTRAEDMRAVLVLVFLVLVHSLALGVVARTVDPILLDLLVCLKLVLRGVGVLLSQLLPRFAGLPRCLRLRVGTSPLARHLVPSLVSLSLINEVQRLL
eukprot:Sspe_Gene.18926::Locus_6844_Transcript_1_1_Confidence_1.000_Length_1820::g.18926::m.18926